MFCKIKTKKGFVFEKMLYDLHIIEGLSKDYWIIVSYIWELFTLMLHRNKYYFEITI